MAKTIFCIIGKSGSGKTTYFEYLMSLIRSGNMLSGYNIKPLVYHTTREVRKGEDTDSYIFDSDNDFLEYQDNNEVLEWRMYEKYDTTVYYYTLYSDIKDDCDAYLCTASVDQLFSYINRGLYNIYIIDISVPVKERLKRLIDRCNTETECYEVCRRAIEETSEYNRINKLPDEFINDDKVLKVYNYTNDGIDTAINIINNINDIERFIVDKLSKN